MLTEQGWLLQSRAGASARGAVCPGGVDAAQGEDRSGAGRRQLEQTGRGDPDGGSRVAVLARAALVSAARPWWWPPTSGRSTRRAARRGWASPVARLPFGEPPRPWPRPETFLSPEKKISTRATTPASLRLPGLERGTPRCASPPRRPRSRLRTRASRCPPGTRAARRSHP